MSMQIDAWEYLLLLRFATSKIHYARYETFYSTLEEFRFDASRRIWRNLWNVFSYKKQDWHQLSNWSSPWTDLYKKCKNSRFFIKFAKFIFLCLSQIRYLAIARDQFFSLNCGQRIEIFHTHENQRVCT